MSREVFSAVCLSISLALLPVLFSMEGMSLVRKEVVLGSVAVPALLAVVEIVTRSTERQGSQAFA